MIITLCVKLGTAWSVDMEYDDSTVLAEVHHAIQQAVEFDNDHLYAFFVARNERAQKRFMLDDENELVFSRELNQLFPLPDKQSLFYLFDYGDNWIFKIVPTRKRPHEPVAGIEYPRVVKETGTKPIQYSNPDDWDEE